MTQTGTMTKLLNKRHENMNIKQNTKPQVTTHKYIVLFIFVARPNVPQCATLHP